MSDPISAGSAVLAILGDDGLPPKMVPCMRCKAQCECPGLIYQVISSWNRREARLADKQERHADLIRSAEIWLCEPCRPLERADRIAKSIDENATTRVYLAELYRGHYNADTIAWLRAHGHSRRVDAKLGEIGSKQ